MTHIEAQSKHYAMLPELIVDVRHQSTVLSKRLVTVEGTCVNLQKLFQKAHNLNV